MVAHRREWQDPTYVAAMRRIDAGVPRIPHVIVITHVVDGVYRFWDGSHWTTSLDKAQQFISEFSAWDVAEPLQDGHVDVELLPDLPLPHDRVISRRTG